MSTVADAARPAPIAAGAARRRRLVLWLFAINAAAQLPTFLTLSGSLSYGPALVVCALVYAGLTFRFRALARAHHRPRLITRLLDEPLFALWGAGLFSLPVFATLVVGGLPLCARVAGGLSFAELVRGSATLSLGIGALFSAWAVWGARRRVRVVQVEVPIRGLDPAFDGYRIAHLTDLHIGSFDPKERGLEWARLANAEAADLCVVTGDLVTAGTTFYEDAADVVGALRASDGVVVSMGNHDQWDQGAFVRALRARGATVLCNEALAIHRANATLSIAGLGDWYTGSDDLDAALGACRASSPIVLLSHYPRFFEKAADRGVALVLSGHTHGGQLGLPGVADRVNFATLTGQRARGLYRRGDSRLYVSAGLGTTGPPMRLGISPEIAQITLRRLEAGAASGAESG